MEAARVNKGVSIWKGFLYLAVVALIGGVLFVSYLLVMEVLFGESNTPRTGVEKRLMESKAAVEENPKDAKARTLLGIAYSDIGDYPQAIGELNMAIKLDSESQRAYYSMAQVYERQGDTQKAIASLANLIKMTETSDKFGKQGHEPAYFQIGRLYVGQKKYDKAIESLNKALVLNRTGGDTLLYMGLAYEGKGDRERALDNYREALTYDPTLDEAKERLSALEGKTAK